MNNQLNEDLEKSFTHTRPEPKIIHQLQGSLSKAEEKIHQELKREFVNEINNREPLTTEKEIDDRHFFLYAKHWYKQTDVIEDLKKIQAHLKRSITQNVVDCLYSETYYKIVNCINYLSGPLHPHKHAYDRYI